MCCTILMRPTAWISGGWTGSKVRITNGSTKSRATRWTRANVSTRCGCSITCTRWTSPAPGSVRCSFSRYAGPGSHRYAIGFSGDSGVSWESLRFQPYFTAAASNIGYCWWSHDIGGHYGGYRDDELTLRWIQLGTFSPISRLHSSTSHFIRKEPWFFPPEIADAMKQALRLRHQLFRTCTQ